VSTPLLSEWLQRCQPHQHILISICIPTLNRARYLREAIASIAPQMGPDIELVVYDTGSNDGTAELMDDVTTLFPDVHYVRREEVLGVDETLLLLLEQSRGDYVWFFGSDDVLKAGAIDKIRHALTRSSSPLTLLHLNHEIVDLSDNLLIASQTRYKSDRHYRVGWRCVPGLGINLGYISACIVRRQRAMAVDDCREFIGSRWLSLHLYLSALIGGGAAELFAEPLIRARRNPSACAEYSEVFVRQTARVLRAARRHGYPWHVIYRTMNRIVATQYLRFIVSWRADNPAELARTFPVMLRACWMYPSFWMLLFPVRVAPAWIVRWVRNQLRERRARRNARHSTMNATANEEKCTVADPSTSLPKPFRALLHCRKAIASWNLDHIFKSIPAVVTAYRRIYTLLTPKQIVQTQFRGHTLYLNLSDQVIARSLITMGTWERYETDVFAGFVEEGMVVVDVGANLGHYTLEAARRVGKYGKVFAFEPEPHNFELLCRNVEANGYSNVLPIRKALSNRTGTSSFALSSDNLGAHRITDSTDSGKAIQVETIPLDEFLRTYGMKVDLVKMDAEGAEALILDGMSEALAANPDLIIFTEYMPRAIAAVGTSPDAFLEKLVDAGFSVNMIDDESNRITEIAPDQIAAVTHPLLDQSAEKFHINLLCVRGRFAAKIGAGPKGNAVWQRSATAFPEVVSAPFQLQAAAVRGKKL
jgi:FkbM family methyltransferase